VAIADRSINETDEEVGSDNLVDSPEEELQVKAPVAASVRGSGPSEFDNLVVWTGERNEDHTSFHRCSIFG
jgi:hypothetical protein